MLLFREGMAVGYAPQQTAAEQQQQQLRRRYEKQKARGGGAGGAGGYRIFIKTLTGRTVTISCSSTEPIALVKSKLMDKVGPWP